MKKKRIPQLALQRITQRLPAPHHPSLHQSLRRIPLNLEIPLPFPLMPLPAPIRIPLPRRRIILELQQRHLHFLPVRHPAVPPHIPRKRILRN